MSLNEVWLYFLGEDINLLRLQGRSKARFVGIKLCFKVLSHEFSCGEVVDVINVINYRWLKFFKFLILGLRRVVFKWKTCQCSYISCGEPLYNYFQNICYIQSTLHDNNGHIEVLFGRGYLSGQRNTSKWLWRAAAANESKISCYFSTLESDTKSLPHGHK